MSPGHAIGIDVGGTSVKLGLIDRQNRVVRRSVVDTGVSSEPKSVVATLAREAKRLASGEELEAIGVGCAGLIDVEAGLVRLSPNLPAWRDVPLARLLSDACGRRVSLLNDANAFGWGEGRHGAGAGCRAGLFLTLGTGVGGVILVDGEIYGGAHGMAGEVGHLAVDVDGEECPCGGRGCLERLVGNARIVERAERKVRSGASGDGIARAAGGDPITPKAIAEAAAAGDPTARAVFDEVGELLGTALAGVANLLDLDVIVVGGGVAQAGDAIFSPARRAFEKRVMAPPDIRAAIRPARFGADAGLVGAAAWARDRAGSTPEPAG